LVPLRDTIRSVRSPKQGHRSHVGGRWDEIGTLQSGFLVEQGLKPEDRLLDVGCGSLRGGIHFVRYLNDGCYHGLDIDQRLLDAGRRELAQAGLGDRRVTLLADDAFRFAKFNEQFDYALAQSVFTHLPFNVIMRCLAEIEDALVVGGRFYATFFRNPGRRLNVEPYRASDEITAFADSDPFYYDPDIFRWAVDGSSLSCDLIGEWSHPRNQQMLKFTKTKGAG
jgi:SAM-dependent methyltransferase